MPTPSAPVSLTGEFARLPVRCVDFINLGSIPHSMTQPPDGWIQLTQRSPATTEP
jgi:hypothetical protein